MSERKIKWSFRKYCMCEIWNDIILIKVDLYIQKNKSETVDFLTNSELPKRIKIVGSFLIQESIEIPLRSQDRWLYFASQHSDIFTSIMQKLFQFLIFFFLRFYRIFSLLQLLHKPFNSFLFIINNIHQNQFLLKHRFLSFRYFLYLWSKLMYSVF